MTEQEKEQRERLRRLIDGNIPNFSISLSYEGEPKSEEERKAEFKQFIARINRRRQQIRKEKLQIIREKSR